ncbi:hypothetical protein [Palaeococcus ferrophilus]|uniref:hypothetical protein n=1 Tax=Palaeococcus ferrophilus TaxID=83868 RepID=UPI00064F562F|nr:hypothetical protein [Palaeococcus ferrophilus]
MEREFRRIMGEDLANYLELLRAKMAFAEEMYGIRMNYVPLITDGEIVILDKNDGKIKWLKTKRPLTLEEFRSLAGRIKENLESGHVEGLLAMNMPCVNGPGE